MVTILGVIPGVASCAASAGTDRPASAKRTTPQVTNLRMERSPCGRCLQRAPFRVPAALSSRPRRPGLGSRGAAAQAVSDTKTCQGSTVLNSCQLIPGAQTPAGSTSSHVHALPRRISCELFDTHSARLPLDDDRCLTPPASRGTARRDRPAPAGLAAARGACAYAVPSPRAPASRSASSSSAPSASMPEAQMAGSSRSSPTTCASSAGEREPPSRSMSR